MSKQTLGSRLSQGSRRRCISWPRCSSREASRFPWAKQSETLTARPIVTHENVHGKLARLFSLLFAILPFLRRTAATDAKREFPDKASNNNTEISFAIECC